MRRSWLVAIIAAAAQAAPAQDDFLDLAKKEGCPGINKAKHSDGLYHFTYDSWVKRGENRGLYILGRCVHDVAKREMFVDWKKTNVKGYATKQNGYVVHTELPSLTNQVVLLDTDLWYGAGPNRKINAPYREAKKPDKPQAADPRAEFPVLKSRIRIGVPEIKGQRRPNLVSIRAEFTSDVWRLSNGSFLYRYGWRDYLAQERETKIAFQWNSQSVTLAKARFVRDEGRWLLLDRAVTGVFLVSQSAPGYAVTTVDFLDRESQPAASAPVALYFPIREIGKP